LLPEGSPTSGNDIWNDPMYSGAELQEIIHSLRRS